MSHYTRRPRRREGGGTVANIMMLLGGAAVVLGLVIVYQKNTSSGLPAPPMRLPGYNDKDPTPESENGTVGDDAYLKRGFVPNKGGTVSTGETQPAPRFVGDSEWKQYHLPDCKRAKLLDEQRRTLFATPEEAFAAGYIPCKVCRPEVPAGRATNPVTPLVPKTTPRTNPKTKTGDTAVSLPIKDVEISFPFTVKSRDVINEKGVISIDYEVDVQRRLEQGEVMKLAQKLVAQETAKGPINALSLQVHYTAAKGGTTMKWIGSADWAPYGVLTRAGEVKAGDYRYHKFELGPFWGSFDLKGR